MNIRAVRYPLHNPYLSTATGHPLLGVSLFRQPAGNGLRTGPSTQRVPADGMVATC